MTIKINTVKPEQLKSHEADFGTAVAQSLWEKIGNYQNWTDSEIPIGFLLFFHGSQTAANGTPITPPNPDLWVLCNGQIINDANSPLNGLHTPDLRGKYLKGSTTTGTTGGQSTINLSHNHTGYLVNENDESGRSNARAGGNYVAGSLHTHSIASSWSSAESVIPPTKEVQIYMRKK